MIGFQDVTLSWQDREYVLPANKVLPVCRDLEDALVGPKGEPPEVMLFRHGGPGDARLSAACGIALRAAMAASATPGTIPDRVTDEEIYIFLKSAKVNEDFEAQRQMMEVCLLLLAILSPPASEKLKAFQVQAETPAEGKGEPAVADSSKASTD